ncbi:UNVERIFIED_CONTAM: DNA replication/repair protein RecF [Spiribacter pallidus]
MTQPADADGLERLGWTGFRGLAPGSIDPDPGLNLIHGDNAAGKTSLVEAIYFLARARSFITHRTARVIANGQDAAVVNGRIRAKGQAYRLGVGHQQGETRVRLNGADTRALSESAWLLPIQVVNTEVQRLLTDGPDGRRAFLNWGVFHVKPGYRADWRRYRRALQQRNAALKTGHRQLSATWEPEMAEAGKRVDDQRRAFLAKLEPVCQKLWQQWLPDRSIEWRLRSGWPDGSGLDEILDTHRDRELAQGHGLYGPHRADLRVLADGVDATAQLSRGQQKLLVTAMRLALTELWGEQRAGRPVLLLDDLPAELDAGHRRALLDYLLCTPAQCFVTAIDATQLPLEAHGQWFHVEQGRVTAV